MKRTKQQKEAEMFESYGGKNYQYLGSDFGTGASYTGLHYDYTIIDDIIDFSDMVALDLTDGETGVYGAVMCGWGGKPLGYYKSNDPYLKTRKEIVIEGFKRLKA